jgi:hypothetical protein
MPVRTLIAYRVNSLSRTACLSWSEKDFAIVASYQKYWRHVKHYL